MECQYYHVDAGRGVVVLQSPRSLFTWSVGYNNEMKIYWKTEQSFPIRALYALVMGLATVLIVYTGQVVLEIEPSFGSNE